MVSQPLRPPSCIVQDVHGLPSMAASGLAPPAADAPLAAQVRLPPLRLMVRLSDDSPPEGTVTSALLSSYTPDLTQIVAGPMGDRTENAPVESVVDALMPPMTTAQPTGWPVVASRSVPDTAALGPTW